jgi:hypothetical protein
LKPSNTPLGTPLAVGLLVTRIFETRKYIKTENFSTRLVKHDNRDEKTFYWVIIIKAG